MATFKEGGLLLIISRSERAELELSGFTPGARTFFVAPCKVLGPELDFFLIFGTRQHRGIEISRTP